MTKSVEKAEEQLREITECSICMSAFNDPRILPCIHTFCFQCLKRTSEAAQLKPGDKMPCPLCRKEFIIPADGMKGVQKNYFMENLLEFKTTLQMGSATTTCDIGSDTISEMKPPFTKTYCSKHTQKPLDYYCADCKKIVCVSCFVESHSLHKCKDVTTIEEEFRQIIHRNSSKVSIYADEILSLKKNAEIRKADFRKEIVDKENKIHKRNQELKDIIDEHTKSLLDELSVIKSKHLKEMETGMKEIDRYGTILKSFEAYCTELTLKGSARDICSSIDELIVRADELKRDHEAFISLPRKSVEVSFQATDLREVLQKYNNCLGQIKGSELQEHDRRSLVKVDSLRDRCNIRLNVDGSGWPTELEVEQRIRNPTKVSSLAGRITSNIPDMMGLDDETPRVKMSCGHAIAPSSLALHCYYELKKGSHSIRCPARGCDTVWSFTSVRDAACLSPNETKEFERKMISNRLLDQSNEIKRCPGCGNSCRRLNENDQRMRCKKCTSEKGRNFYFCWSCLKEWRNSRNAALCGNFECEDHALLRQILASSETKTLNGIECPSRRACPNCLTLIEHTGKCKHMTCPNRRCNYNFCFICLKRYPCETGAYEACRLAPQQTFSLPPPPPLSSCSIQ